MARTRTLVQLRTEVLQTADMENVGAFLDTATGGEVDRYINASIQDLYDLIVEVMGQEYFLKSNTFSTVGGTEEYTIDTTVGGAFEEFYALRGVDWESGDDKYPLRPYSFDERHDDNNVWYPVSIEGKPSRYRLSGSSATTGHTSTIRLTPTPAGVGTIRLWYIPHSPLLALDTDVFDGFNGWEEYVVVDAAIKCLQKEESDTQALEVRKNRLIERIRSMAANRDMGHNETVADTEDYC